MKRQGNLSSFREIKLGNNLKYYRKHAGYSQSELAYLVGTTQNTISSIENGVYDPTYKLALALSTVLGCDEVEDLFFHDDHGAWRYEHSIEKIKKDQESEPDQEDIEYIKTNKPFEYKFIRKVGMEVCFNNGRKGKIKKIETYYTIIDVNGQEFVGTPTTIFPLKKDRPT